VCVFVVSFVLTALIVRSARLPRRRTCDRDFNEPQKFHARAEPRIGSLAILVGLMVDLLPLHHPLGDPVVLEGAVLLACAMPLFISGFAHDGPAHRALSRAA
jgi:hypothetical protein